MSTLRGSARGLVRSMMDTDIGQADQIFDYDLEDKTDLLDELEIDGKPTAETKRWDTKLYKVTFSTENLNVYTRPTRTKPRSTVLHSINAIFKPGTTTALMGPSGAGKTTLLNVLSGRTQNSLSIEAKGLKLNGENLTSAEVKAVSSLVPQDDVLIAVLTPREMITYGARLVLNLPLEEINAVVNKTLKILSLTGCADTMCGDADVKGISGGERKRASIGMELITNPSCIFLDEPTSGLDSKVALDVVKTLQNLASEGRTIVCTIHQPSYSTFLLFDRLLLLKKGQVAYQGRTAEVADYFTRIGYPCPEYQNPADHILNTVSLPEFDVNFEDRENKLYKEFTAYAREQGNKDHIDMKNRKSQHKREITKIPLLIERSFYVTYKDVKQLRTRFLQVLIVGLVAGLTYLQLERVQIASFDRQSALLMATMFIMMSSIMTTINSIPMEKTMLKREYQNGVYEVKTFFLSRLFVYYSFQTFYVSIYCILVYFMVGFEPKFQNFLTFFMAVLLGSVISVTLGFFFGSIFPNVQQATSVVPMLILPLILFSGLLISFESIPVYFVWIYYISFMQYIFRILIINEFEDLQFEPCTLEDVNTNRCLFGLCGGLGLTVDENNNTIFDSKSCSGQVVLESSGFDNIEIWASFMVLLAFWLFAFTMCFVGVYKFLNPGFRIIPFKINVRGLFRRRVSEDLEQVTL